MRTNQLILRCFAECDAGQWVVVCVDLNLAAQGDSFDEARKKLHDQIFWYVQDATVGPDREHGAQLLARKAPLSLRARYYLATVKGHVYSLRNRFRSFSEALPLGPTQLPA